MGKPKTDSAGEGKRGVSAWKKGSLAINFLGLLAAFGIGFGGLFLVQYRLEQEEAMLLKGAGAVEIPLPVEVEVSDAGEADVEQEKLTEAELYQAVKCLYNGMESYPHEPRSGQLSMAQALNCATDWIKDFLLPHMGMDDLSLQEQSINCYLWTWQEDRTGREMNPSFSYWDVWIYTPGLETELILEASSGQVMRAIVNCSLLTEYQNKDLIREILADYAASFGLPGDIRILDGRKDSTGASNAWMIQKIGEEGLYASVTTNSFVISKADAALMDYTEIFSMNLSLSTDEGLEQ